MSPVASLVPELIPIFIPNLNEGIFFALSKFIAKFSAPLLGNPRWFIRALSSGSRNKLGEINEITLRTLPFNKINKNYEPCQIENGFRAVLLPSQVYLIEKLLINNQIKYQSFNPMGIIDYVYAGERVLDDKKLFFKKFYKLQNFIPILLNKKEDNDYKKLIMRLGENVIKN